MSWFNIQIINSWDFLLLLVCIMDGKIHVFLCGLNCFHGVVHLSWFNTLHLFYMIYGSHLLCYQINSINHVCDSKRFQQNKQIINQILLSSDASFIYVIIISSAVQLVASMDPSTVQQQQQMTANQPPRPPITSSRPPVVPCHMTSCFLS